MLRDRLDTPLAQCFARLPRRFHVVRHQLAILATGIQQVGTHSSTASCRGVRFRSWKLYVIAPSFTPPTVESGLAPKGMRQAVRTPRFFQSLVVSLPSPIRDCVGRTPDR